MISKTTYEQLLHFEFKGALKDAAQVFIGQFRAGVVGYDHPDVVTGWRLTYLLGPDTVLNMDISSWWIESSRRMLAGARWDEAFTDDKFIASVTAWGGATKRSYETPTLQPLEVKASGGSAP